MSWSESHWSTIFRTVTALSLVTIITTITVIITVSTALTCPFQRLSNPLHFH
jgi:hypothetical protein